MLREKVVTQLAKELKAYANSKKESFLLVHGAGSLAHSLAKRYDLANLKRPHKNVSGITQTHHAVLLLNNLITEIFLKKKFPVFPLLPAALFLQREGRISQAFLKPVGSLLEQRFIPLLYGDMVIDETSRFSICSSDQIASYLSNVFAAKRVLFLTDVDGVFEQDPKTNPQTKMLKHIYKKDIRSLFVSYPRVSARDVTGLMQGKLQETSSIPCSVQVLNGLKKGNFFRALKGEHVGTLII